MTGLDAIRLDAAGLDATGLDATGLDAALRRFGDFEGEDLKEFDGDTEVDGDCFVDLLRPFGL